MRCWARSNQCVTRPSVWSYSDFGTKGWPSRSMAGSCQMELSMGSSVKLTNMEISTAATMVMPNS